MKERNITEDGRQWTRPCIEVTRFFILCNYISRIIEPIASRCAKFRFKPLGHEVMSERLQYISQKEGLTLGEGVFEATATRSGGDLRKAITLLQSAARLFGTNTITGKDIEVWGGWFAGGKREGVFRGLYFMYILNT